MSTHFSSSLRPTRRASTDCSRRGAPTRRRSARAAAIVVRVRRGRRSRAAAVRARLDGSTARSRSRASEIAPGGACRACGRAAGDPYGGASYPAGGARGRFRAAWRVAVAPGVTIEQRVTPLDARRMLRARRPLSAALVSVDDGDSGARRGGERGRSRSARGRRRSCSPRRVEAGVTRVFRVGGAHAIAALAYGTETVPRVDKIVGPGNAYVAAAKTMVVGAIARSISRPGPSEIVIVATRGRAEWIAADLIAQAEHDADARAVLLTPSRRSRTACGARDRAPAAGTAVRRALRWRATAAPIVTRDLHEAIALANRMAPEHLVVPGRARRRQPSVVRARSFVGDVRRAGRRRLCDRIEPRAADRRRGAAARRPERRRLRPRLDVQRVTRSRAGAAGAGDRGAGRGRGPGGQPHRSE